MDQQGAMNLARDLAYKVLVDDWRGEEVRHFFEDPDETPVAGRRPFCDALGLVSPGLRLIYLLKRYDHAGMALDEIGAAMLQAAEAYYVNHLRTTDTREAAYAE